MRALAVRDSNRKGIIARFALMEGLRFAGAVIQLVGIRVGFAAAGIIGNGSASRERKRAFGSGDGIGAVMVVLKSRARQFLHRNTDGLGVVIVHIGHSKAVSRIRILGCACKSLVGIAVHILDAEFHHRQCGESRCGSDNRRVIGTLDGNADAFLHIGAKAVARHQTYGNILRVASLHALHGGRIIVQSELVGCALGGVCIFCQSEFAHIVFGRSGGGCIRGGR